VKVEKRGRAGAAGGSREVASALHGKVKDASEVTNVLVPPEATMVWRNVKWQNMHVR